MEISIHSLLEGAKRAIGSVAVIDVFRAFTTAAVALANGASRIVMVRSIEEALALRDAGIGQICMGEVHGRPPDGFDFGNSPFELSVVDFTGKTIIQRTSAGTQGIVMAASRAERLYAASLVTAEATVRVLLSGSPAQVSLVAMGDNGIKRTDEDELCAIHLRNRLEGRPSDADAIRRLILAGGEVQRFHDPARPYLHPEDVDIALDIDRYDFAIKVEFEDGRPVARMERSMAATQVSATIIATVDKMGQPIPIARDLPKLTPSLRAMLERIERHSGELLELAITASGGREYTKLQRLCRAGYVVRVDHPTVKAGKWPAEALAITEAGKNVLAGREDR